MRKSRWVTSPITKGIDSIHTSVSELNFANLARACAALLPSLLVCLKRDH